LKKARFKREMHQVNPKSLKNLRRPAKGEKPCKADGTPAVSPGQLPLNGMTAAESAATKAFEAKPVALRLAMAEKGKASLGDKFRQTASEEQRRELNRVRVANFRKKPQQINGCNASLTPCNAANAMQKQMQKQMQKEKDIKTPIPPEGLDGDIQESLSKSNSPIPKTPHCEAPPLPENLRTPAFEARAATFAVLNSCTGWPGRGGS
jgi:hypothetical protein